MTQTESTALSPSATTYTLTSDAKMQMMMARKYLMSESNEERYIENMMSNAVVVGKGDKDKNIENKNNPPNANNLHPQLRPAGAHLAHHHHLTHRQRQAMMRRNLSPNFIHGHHGNPSKHLLVINDEDIVDSSHSQLSSSIIIEEVDDDNATETETETMTERKEQHMLGHIGHNMDNMTESVSRYTVENVHIFDVDEDVDSLPVLPATITDGDNVSVTWVSKDGFQYNNNGQLMSSNDTLKLEQTHAGIDGYGWVKAALMEIDSDDWRTYVSNFKKNKVTENRLKDLKGSDLRELIPKIGPRNEFEKLLRQRLDAQRYKE